MRSSVMMINICKLMHNPNSRNYDSTSLNVKPSCFGSHAGCPSLTSDLRESDGRGIISSCSAGLLHCAGCCSSHLMDKGKQVIWENLMEEASCQVALLASSIALVAAPAIWWTKESKWFERIWWKRHHVKLLCWPPPLRWLLLQPSDGQRKASDLRESYGRGIMSSCSAGLLHCAGCCSSHLMDKGKQVIWENLMEEASCQVALLASSIALVAAPAIWWTKESKWFERIWWKRHHVKLLCWPPPLRWLLLQPSDGQRKASDLRESDGRGIMSSCSAGLLHCAGCCSNHLMDKGKQVIWENLMEEASCQVALLASSIALVAAPAIWWTKESKWFERIWWKRHHVKLLCWPPPLRWLLLQPSDGQRKASDLRESDGRGIMSSCSAGLLHCAGCCSSHLMDKGKQVIWENLMEEASCQVALLASSSALILAPAIWGTRTTTYEIHKLDESCFLIFPSPCGKAQHFVLDGYKC